MPVAVGCEATASGSDHDRLQKAKVTMKSIREQIAEMAGGRLARDLADHGFSVVATESGFELKHAGDLYGCGFSGDYHRDVRETVRLFWMGLEAGAAIARKGYTVTTSGDRYNVERRISELANARAVREAQLGVMHTVQGISAAARQKHHMEPHSRDECSTFAYTRTPCEQCR